MFESVGRTMTGHKQVVIAALAVSAMLLYAVPAQQQFAAATILSDDDHVEQNLAQRLVDDTRQRIDQNAEQDQRQDQDQRIDQDIDQTNTADVDQSEENNQANVIDTGDNTATTTQVVDNDANENTLEAKSSGGDAEAKGDKYSHPSATGGSSEAEAEIEQEGSNTATTTQDSSADDNVQVNTNTFGNDFAFVDQDNTADQDAVNVGVQTQEQDINQYATNTDLTANVGEQHQEFCDPLDIALIQAPILAHVC